MLGATKYIECKVLYMNFALKAALLRPQMAGEHNELYVLRGAM